MIVDANVLLYAVDQRSSFHAIASPWLCNALNSTERVGFPWVSLLAFQRIATHPRISKQPLSAREAWSFITTWLDADNAWIPSPGIHHREILGHLLTSSNLSSSLVTDAHLAALAIEYGTALCSFDTDFARFPDLNWINPSFNQGMT